MLDMEYSRHVMVERQLARRGIYDPRVLEAMRTVPRELFVPDELRDCAYDDGPLPIGSGQTISQPAVVALMIQAAELSPDSTVLEVGAGSGYAAAVMSRIARKVYAIERHASLAAGAADKLTRLNYSNVEIRTGDGTLGWPEAAPFDAVLVAAGGAEIPEPLKRQMAIHGRLVMPVGGRSGQSLLRVKRTGEDTYETDDLGSVSFVPLVKDPS